MVDILVEKPLSLSEAAKAVPPLDGRRPHASTIWRWCRKGLHGVYLEHARVGHRVCTTREAIARFAAKLAEVENSRSGDAGVALADETAGV